MKPSELHPAHPDRICWGCQRHCGANDLGCGNGSIRTPHPVELFGDDWLQDRLQTTDYRLQTTDGGRPTTDG